MRKQEDNLITESRENQVWVPLRTFEEGETALRLNNIVTLNFTVCTYHYNSETGDYSVIYIMSEKILVNKYIIFTGSIKIFQRKEFLFKQSTNRQPFS